MANQSNIPTNPTVPSADARAAQAVDEPRSPPVTPESSAAPRSEAKAADATASDARRRLVDSPYKALNHISCSSYDGTLVLRGRVASYYLKQLAQEFARHAHGAGEIVNKVQVRESGGRN